MELCAVSIYSYGPYSTAQRSTHQSHKLSIYFHWTYLMFQPMPSFPASPIATCVNVEFKPTQSEHGLVNKSTSPSAAAALGMLEQYQIVASALRLLQDACYAYTAHTEERNFEQLLTLHDTAIKLHKAMTDAERNSGSASGMTRTICDEAQLHLTQVTTANPAILSIRLAELDERVKRFLSSAPALAGFPDLHAAALAYVSALNAQPLQMRNGGRRITADIHEATWKKICEEASMPAAPAALSKILSAAQDKGKARMTGAQSGSTFARTERDRFAIKLQAQLRGRKIRKQLTVEKITDGVTHVALRANADFFRRLHVDGMNTERGPKIVDYLAVSNSHFSFHVSASDRLVSNTLKDTSLREILCSYQPSNGTVIYINASYFNSGQLTAPGMPSHATIGEAGITGAPPIPHVPIPKDYRSDYYRITFDDRSFVTVGPLLSEGGKAKFLSNRLKKMKYQYSRNTDLPGQLGHASTPNPRSAISLPAATSKASKPKFYGDRSRMVIVREDIRSWDGMTLPELSSLMARLDRLNGYPGASYNLDGGKSAILGVLSENGHHLWQGRQIVPGSASTFIIATAKDSTSPG